MNVCVKEAAEDAAAAGTARARPHHSIVRRGEPEHRRDAQYEGSCLECRQHKQYISYKQFGKQK